MPFLLGDADNDQLAYEFHAACVKADVRPPHMRRAIKEGRLPVARVYGQDLILREDLLRFLREERDRSRCTHSKKAA